MKIIRFDLIGGASGDMILAALADLGADLDAVRSELAGLKIGKFSVGSRETTRDGFRGKRVTVTASARGPHHERTLRDIEKIISRSALPETVKRMSSEVFRNLAEAEAIVHGTAPDKIHFHEVGAVDAIVDIAGSCAALRLLAPDAVSLGPFPIAYGTVNCKHGLMPLPAPATLELIKGYPAVETGETDELVTPTGAALLTAWAAMFPDAARSRPILRPLKTGIGFGSRVLKTRPNLLRAIFMETVPGNRESGDDCLVMECNIDDATPELVGFLTRAALEKGALDVFTLPAQMKKQRPGTLLTVLCRPADREEMLDLLFRESTTFGVRERLVNRVTLDRRIESVRTPFGSVRIKIGRWKNKDVTLSPEFDDCLRCAKASGSPVKTVYETASALAHAVKRKTARLRTRIPRAAGTRRRRPESRA